jgi:hypothetical protein
LPFCRLVLELSERAVSSAAECTDLRAKLVKLQHANEHLSAERNGLQKVRVVSCAGRSASRKKRHLGEWSWLWWASRSLWEQVWRATSCASLHRDLVLLLRRSVTP